MSPSVVAVVIAIFFILRSQKEIVLSYQHDRDRNTSLIRDRISS
ncbi:MAG: hypothetical protein QNJ55_31965 [Xenococcus sp. MO_188.B8]|nr:hypothetical protein [Xenococcus sp. MO_188.B8]